MLEYLFLVPISVSLILGVISPGPSFVLVSKTAMSSSRSVGIALCLGMALGAMIFALLASIGLYLILETVPLIYTLLKVIGGLYLGFLAFKLWQSASEPISSHSNVGSKKLFRSFILGLITQLSNPKTAILIAGIFAAFMPQNPPPFSYLLLCILAFIIDLAWYSLVTVALSTRKAQNIYVRYKTQICRSSAGIVGLIGLKLATST
jgi:threonine/homoserine/homoserine lactone efflux protein